MDKIFVDESGYTGYDLMNSQQQFQGASAILISELEAKDLILKHFPDSKASELKYRKLAKKKKYWASLLELQRELLSKYYCVTYICSKRYLLILLLLDIAIEPFYYHQDFDFYEGGNNYSLASLLFYVGPTLFGNDQFEHVLGLFQHAVKSKSDIAIVTLVEAVKSMPWRELPECWGPLAIEYPACIKSIQSDKSSTDAAYVVLFSLINRIENTRDSEYQIVHDRSGNLKKYHQLIQKLITHKINKEFIQSKLTTLNFPLKLCEVKQVDSKSSYAVQLSDILIGAAIENANALIGLKEKNEYNMAVSTLYSDDQFIHLIPNIDFDENKDFRSNAQSSEVIEYFAKHFS